MSKWKNAKKKKPDLIGEMILVQMIGIEKLIRYAIYSGEDEFDVHDPNYAPDHRKYWYKFSSKSIRKWRYLPQK